MEARLLLSSFTIDELRSLISETIRTEYQACRQADLQVQPASDTFLTIQQAAAFLHLSVQTVYALVNRNEIPVSKQGKRLYFLREELAGWISQGKRKSKAEVQFETDTFLASKKKRR